MQEATADKPGVITYKCQRQGCDYTELAEIPVKNTNTVDGKTDASEEDKNSNTENASVDKDSTSGKIDPADSDTSADSKNEDAEEDLPDEDIDEEYASYASSTSTDIVTEYDPETAVGTIRVAKKDSDDPTETEEVTGMTVPAGTTEIKKDADGNITDLAVSTAIDEVKNGFSLTSESKTLKSISIINAKDLSNDWFTLNAGKTAGELGIHVEYEKDKITLTLTENNKMLNIVKVTEDETTITMKTSTGGSFVIRKNLQKFSTKLEGVVKGTKNRIVLKGTEGAKPSVELSYVKEKREDDKAVKETSEKDNETENKENSEDSANADENANEEHYWIRAYNDEVEDPIVITVYKK